MSSIDLSLVLKLETLAADAWPAAESVVLDGWRLRYTGGVTRRANSVWPNASQASIPLDEKFAQVESFYAKRQLPARYQISPAGQPRDLDEQLERRGYASVARTAVQTAELAVILRNTAPLRLFPEFEVEVSEAFDSSWFAVYTAVEHVDGAGATLRRGILERVAHPAGFALLYANGVPAAVGLGVVSAGWVGVFCMATDPAHRRRGAASAILRTLAIWAQLYGTEQAYLQVAASNYPAQMLYASTGFSTAYHYTYREQTPEDRRVERTATTPGVTNDE